MSWLLSTYKRDTNTFIIQDFYESKSCIFKQCAESGLLQTHAIYRTIIKHYLIWAIAFLNAHGSFLEHILYREREISNIAHAMSNIILQECLATTQ